MTDLVKAKLIENKGHFKKGHKIQPLIPSQITHGMSSRKARNPIYSAWSRMKRRCNNENSKEYVAYGAKGIKVSDSWAKSFPNFYTDMGTSWFAGASLDRIDNSKGYSKENCRWATMADQARNKTTVRLYDFEGERLTIPQIAEKVGIKPKTLYARLVRQKWPLERAVLINA